MDLLIDPASNDLVFVNGKVTTTRDLVESTAQKLKLKLLTFLGEWFLDTTYGIPYYQQIFGKGRTKASLDAIFQTKILEEDHILELLQYESNMATDRSYSATFAVRTEDGISGPITITIGG